MSRTGIIVGSCLALAACTPLLGLDGLKFRDAGGGGGGGGGAKPGAPIWATVIGDVGDDAARAIAVAGDDVLVAGCLGAAPSATDAGAGGGAMMNPPTAGRCSAPAAAFVARLDASGKQETLHRLAASGDADALGVAPAPNGGTFVAGSYGATIFDGTKHQLPPAAMRLPFVAELDAAGAPIWTSSLGVLGKGRAQALLDDGTGLVVSGFFTGSLPGLDPGTGDDGFYAVLGAKGKFQSGERVEQQAMSDAAYALAVALGPNGEIAIGGNFTGGLQGKSAIDPDGFVALYKKGHKSPEFLVVVSGAGAQSVNGLAFDASGDLFAVGSFVGGVNIGSKKTLTSVAGSLDAFVAKLASDGSVTWAVSFGGPGADDARGVAVDEQGEVYVVGSASDAATFGSKAILNRGGADGYVAKVDGKGNPVWITSMGGSTDDTVDAVALGPSAVFVAGSFTGSARIAGNELDSRGGVDAFVAAFER